MSLNKAFAIILYDSDNKVISNCSIYKTYNKAINELTNIVIEHCDLDIKDKKKYVKDFIRNNDASFNDEEDLFGCHWKYYITEVDSCL